MRECISIHVGQAGVQIGKYFYILGFGDNRLENGTIVLIYI